MARQNLGAEWVASIADLASAYGIGEAEMQQRVYALAEQIHQHYCFNSGPVNHREARPDEHIAAGILGALAATGWLMVKAEERWPTAPASVAMPEFVGDLSRHDEAAVEDALVAQATWDAQQEAKVDAPEG